MKISPLVFVSLFLLSACGRNEAVVPDSHLPAIRTQAVTQASPAPQAKAEEKSAEKPKDDNQVPPPPNNPSLSDEEIAVQAALLRANEIRLENKLSELQLDEKLAVAAQKHAEDMKARNYFSHVNPEKEDPYDRMRKAGATFHAAAENIAHGVPDAKTVFEGWMASPGHKTNLLNKAYGRHGIGYKDGYWVHVFAD